MAPRRRRRGSQTESDAVVERYGFEWLGLPGVYAVRPSGNHVLVEVDDPEKRRRQLPAVVGKVHVRVVRGGPATAAARTA